MNRIYRKEDAMKAVHAEGGVLMDVMRKKDGKGFHPMYIWAIVYVILTYIYPVMIYCAMTTEGESTTSQAAYEVAEEANKSAPGMDPMWFCLIPVGLLLINMIVAICSKRVHRRVLLNSAQIMKYLLIPFYIAGGLLCVAFFLMIFSPVVIMLFVSTALISLFCIMGYISLVGSSTFMIAYLSKSVKDGKNGRLFSCAVGVLQFFFVADVIGTIVCAVKDRNDQGVIRDNEMIV